MPENQELNSFRRWAAGLRFPQLLLLTLFLLLGDLLIPDMIRIKVNIDLQMLRKMLYAFIAPHKARDIELTQVDRWRKLVRDNRDSSIKKKLVSVNEYFNSFEYAEDRYLWNKEDFWATLPETLKKNSGDCEDVSIAKFFTLRYLNVPEDKLRITYVISLKTGQPHMVLTFSPDISQEPIVLDTMNNYLFTVSKRPDLIPVYSFNTRGYWLARKQTGWKGKRVGSADKLSRWQNVLERMRKEETTFIGS